MKKLLSTLEKRFSYAWEGSVTSAALFLLYLHQHSQTYGLSLQG